MARDTCRRGLGPSQLCPRGDTLHTHTPTAELVTRSGDRELRVGGMGSVGLGPAGEPRAGHGRAAAQSGRRELTDYTGSRSYEKPAVADRCLVPGAASRTDQRSLRPRRLTLAVPGASEGPVRRRLALRRVRIRPTGSSLSSPGGPVATCATLENRQRSELLEHPGVFGCEPAEAVGDDAPRPDVECQLKIAPQLFRCEHRFVPGDSGGQRADADHSRLAPEP